LRWYHGIGTISLPDLWIPHYGHPADLLPFQIDTSLSLLGFALTINAAILTLAGAAYFYGDTGSASSDASLEGAFQLIKSYIGNAAAIIFALALLCVSGVSSRGCR
jgi:Mn2+/Fe2+ NRAMP family transporter